MPFGLDVNDIDLISAWDLIQLSMKALNWLKNTKEKVPTAEGNPEDVFLKGTADPEMLQYLLTLCKKGTDLFLYALMGRLTEKEAKGYTYSILRFPNRLREETVHASPKGIGFGVEPKKGKEQKKTIDPRGTGMDSRVLYLEQQYEMWMRLVDDGKTKDEAYAYIIDVLKKGQFLDRETLEEKAKKIWDELVEALKDKEPMINTMIYRTILGDEYECVQRAGGSFRDTCLKKLGRTKAEKEEKWKTERREIWLTAIFGKPSNKKRPARITAGGSKWEGIKNRMLEMQSGPIMGRKGFIPLAFAIFVVIMILFEFLSHWKH